MNAVERHLRPRVLEALDDTRVVVRLGARQVGKSTLVQDVAIPTERCACLATSTAGGICQA